RFWYDYEGNPTRPLRAISSTFFWGFSLLNERLPSLTPNEASALPANARLVFLVPAMQDFERARESLRMHGLDVDVSGHRTCGEGDSLVAVVLADVSRLPGMAAIP